MPDHSISLTRSGRGFAQTKHPWPLVHQLYDGLENRSAICRESPDIMSEHEEEATAEPAPALDQRAPEQVTRLERSRRLTELKERARSPDDAVAAALAFEFWSLGSATLRCGGEDTCNRQDS